MHLECLCLFSLSAADFKWVPAGPVQSIWILFEVLAAVTRNANLSSLRKVKYIGHMLRLLTLSMHKNIPSLLLLSPACLLMLLKWHIMCSAVCWFISCTVGIFGKVGCETDPVFVTDFSPPSRPTYYSYKGFFFFPDFVMQGNWTLNGGFNGFSVQVTEAGCTSRGTTFGGISIDY